MGEDELSADTASPSPDAGDHTADGDAGDDTMEPDDGAEEAPACVVSESEDPEVENGDADLHVSVEDTSEQVDDESESNKQECLISFDDDDAELAGPAADCDVEKCEDNVLSDSPSQDLADVNAVVLEDDVGVQQLSIGDM